MSKTDQELATYYMATALSDWGMPTWKFIFSAGSQLHGADQPFLFGPGTGDGTFFSLPHPFFLTRRRRQGGS